MAQSVIQFIKSDTLEQPELYSNNLGAVEERGERASILPPIKAPAAQHQVSLSVHSKTPRERVTADGKGLISPERWGPTSSVGQDDHDFKDHQDRDFESTKYLNNKELGY